MPTRSAHPKSMSTTTHLLDHVNKIKNDSSLTSEVNVQISKANIEVYHSSPAKGSHPFMYVDVIRV
jgi:hypothetical protein